MITKYPLLYHQAKGGDLRQWQVWTDGKYIVTEYGQVGGKLQQSQKAAEGKNLGRANATSPAEQAELEAKSLWNYKVERKYSETPEGAKETLPLPMLAHSFKGSKKKKFIYPAHSKPKLDGVRCLATRDVEGAVALTSRQGKPWHLPIISAQLDTWLPDDMTLDGEVYIHGMSCQKITSLARSANPNGKSYKPMSQELVYHVYDVPVHEGNEILSWEERANQLYRHTFSETDNVARVPVDDVTSEDHLWDLHGKYIGEGYEGAILRGLQGQYLWGYRSADLLKVKQFQDAEFQVLSARDGKGKMKGAVVFLCRNDLTDGVFECTMKVTMAERRRMYEEQDQYIGQQLTVRFFDRTDDQIPRFPVGIVFRAAIDLPT
jgi:DNA ligase-1